MRITIAFVLLVFPALAVADAPAAAHIEAGKVLVLPFEQIGGDASQRFIARAIQQSLLSQLSRPAVLRPVEVQVGTQLPDPLTAQSAMQIGLSQGAEYVIFGSYQFAGVDLRITGQVLSAGSGAVVTNLRSTGAVRDLFAMEDNIADQAKRALVPPAAVAAAPVPQTLPPNPAPSTPDTFEGSALQQSLMSGRNYNRDNMQSNYNSYYMNPYPIPYYNYGNYYYPFAGAPYYTPGYGYNSFTGAGFFYVNQTPTTRRTH